MKLFKSLLVAPATLGLLAPMSATANEVTINDFNAAEEIAVTNSRVDGLEARFNNLEAGSFSDTTSASFGSTFYVGSVDEGPVTFSYDFALGLNTSFTGEDSFDVAIIGGNADSTAVDGVMGGDGTGDDLVLDGISYTFPVGGFTVIAGDGTGVDDLNSGACAYSAFTDTAGDCGTPSIGGGADSAVAASYDFGNGFTAAGGIGFGQADGILNDQDASTLGLEVAYAADTYSVALAYTDDDDAAGDGTFYSLQGSYTPDAPYSISAGYEFDDDDETSYFLGLTTEAGPGSLSVGFGTMGLSDDTMYEVSYSYAVNDNMTVTPGFFSQDDVTGYVVTTGFSF